MIRIILAGATLSLVAGCSTWTLGGYQDPGRQTDAIERSSLKLSKSPQPAAACIVENANAAGMFADSVPLYGLESMAVTVKSRIAGELIAVFSLSRNNDGARADTTTWSGVTDREALLQRFVQGC